MRLKTLKRTPLKWMALFMSMIILLATIPANVFALGKVESYNEFMEDLKVLEGYAKTYASKLVTKDEGELVLNFIRTGVERYQDGNWETLAGPEDVGFTSYVEEQDQLNNTTAMDLKDIDISNFTVPNGNQVDFGHMFGCMNISYVNKGSADLSGWAGDICDLLQYCVEKGNVPNGTVDEMAAYIQEKCFGVDASGAFGWDDFWGDMDAYYLVTEYKKAGGAVPFSTLMEEYFTSALSDIDRTVYFMNNRFGVADNQAAVRKALYESYSSDVSIKILESKRGLSSYSKLREACCYAVADYIYSQAKGKLIEGSANDEAAANGYYTVFNNEHSVLAPGITQDINYAQTVDGKQIVYYVATVDVKRDDVTIMVNYKDNKPPVAGQHIGLQRVEDQVAALVKNNADKENFYPIVATNGSGYNITNGTPSGLVFMQGVEYYPANAPGFFAILKDGTAMIGTKDDYEANKAQIQEGIQAFGYVLVKDGKVDVTKNANYTSSRASRTAIGIKADGSVVMMVLDGRQLPYSAGGALEEIAQIMLEAGCVQAVNLDGGGSTTYMSKAAGSDTIQLVNRPSDGYARSVATSLVAVSTAAPSTAFDHAILSSDYQYITAGTSMQFNVTGVSNTGNAAAIPEGSYWRVSDTSIGTIDANGLFTAIKNGTVDVEYIVNGEVEGSITVRVVVPDALSMESTSMTAIYGQPATMPIVATYRGKRVCVKSEDFTSAIVYTYIDKEGKPANLYNYLAGLTFTEPVGSEYRTITVGAILNANTNLIAYLTVNMYREDETIFDFNNATSGNRVLAWYREISNTHTFDDLLYRVSDDNTPVEMDYTFALDMKAISIPSRLEPLLLKLPTYQEGATAWDYMLQMANRVCEQTKVTITVDFSKDVTVDISELKIVNDFFVLTSATLDENNRLTLICNWVYQPSSIDPSAANSLCLLTGVKTILKDTAAFYNDEIIISNNGTVSYDIYLGAGSLYSFAKDPANNAQSVFGLHPYDHGEGCKVTGDTAGAYFSDVYVDFADTFAISTEKINGWHEDYYYVDNVPVTGVQLVPDRHNKDQLRFYEFDENGKIVNEQGMTGLLTFEDDLYYAVLGVAQTGWQQIDGKNYYFHPDTGKAANGKYTIKEKQNPAVAEGKYTPMVEYTYTFTDYVLTLGDWVYDTNINGNDGKKHTGWHYRWAGDWKDGWFEVEGNWYFANKNYPNMTSTGYVRIMKQDAASSSDTQYHLLTKDEMGALQKDYTGIYKDGSKYSFLQNGVRVISSNRLYQGNDGYYYCTDGTGYIHTNISKNLNATQTNGLAPADKTYTFDEYGRLTNNLTNLTNEKIENAISGVEIGIYGKVLTVSNKDACKIGYLKDGAFVELNAIANTLGSYNYIISDEITEVVIVLCGDVSGDGALSYEDISLLQSAMLGLSDEISVTGWLAADANGDGAINAADLARIYAAIMGNANTEW